MILNALVKYYEALAEKGRIPRVGYGTARVSFALCLDEDGRLTDVVSLKDEVQVGKKTVERPRQMTVPEPASRSVNIEPSFLCDHGGYLLGYDDKGRPERTRSYYEAAKALHLSVLEPLDDPVARAIVRFFQTWEPASAAEHPALDRNRDEILKGANLVFLLGDRFAHECPAIREAWERYRAGRTPETSMVCLVSGRREPIAQLHPKIKGVRDAQSSGASLVSFNASAFESYGREGEQGLNAPTSEYAAFAYGAALNRLLQDAGHRVQIGDATVVFWSEDANEKPRDLMALTLGAGGPDQDADQTLRGVFSNLARGLPVDPDIDLGCPFYVLGLAPNAARLSVRFFLRDRFGNMLQNIRAHYAQLEIARAPFERAYLLPSALLMETVNPNSTSKQSSPLMSGALMRAILTGQRYPQALFAAVMIRIRADRRITRGRAAIIKAYLIRNCKMEGCTVSLDETRADRAYVLGRLFSMLEAIQQAGNPGINATIRDRYFDAACATPAVVFPTLLKLAGHHTAKLEDKLRIYYEKRLTALIGMLSAERYPARLTLEDQGLFINGYYHQTQDRYTKKQDGEDQSNG